MKLTKSQLKELIRHSIQSIVSEEDVMDKKIKYKDAEGNEKEGTVGGILKKGEDHPAHKQAQQMVDKDKGTKKPTKKTKISADPFGDKPPFKGGKPSKDDDEFDVGGPAYPKVPKGVKTSADAKGVMKARDLAKQAMDTSKEEKPKYRHPAMNDLDWDEEIPPEDLHGFVDDNKEKISRSSQKRVYDLLDKIQAAHDEEDYDNAVFHQKRLQKTLDSYMQITRDDKKRAELDKQTMGAADAANLKMQKDVTDSAAQDIGYDDAEDLIMGGEADEIAELVDHDDVYESIPEDLIDPFNNALDFIRDNEQGVRSDDEDRVNFYRKELLKMIQNPTGYGKKKEVKESKMRRFTVKEVRTWMKTLEENRYKKVYNSDARRVSWMVNHVGESVENMPKSMRKKWTKAAYGRERYLAKEFLKSQLASLKEQKLRKAIREIIKEQIHHSDMRMLYVPKKDFKNAVKLLRLNIKHGNVEVEKKPSDKVKGFYRFTTTKKMFDDVVTHLAMKKIGVKTIAKGKM